MTNFAISPATPTTVVREDLAAMLADGELRAYRIRGNGTMRHVELYPLGSTRRDTAEWISEQANDGRSVAYVARELHVSTAAVRRIQLSLELTEEIEAGEWDGLLTGTGLYSDAETVELHDEVAPDARPGTTVTAETASDVAGSHCEPEGTTAEELEDTLKASLGQNGKDLHYCVCSSLEGQHARGVAGCKWAVANDAAHAATPRKVRSH